tara:strand:- start:4811 stop:9541 length:4731 start_codon:yes stop_codon:yes gene_type:complete
MISEQQTWEILGDYFNKKGFVTHQIESFNEFIQNGISKVISEEPDIKIVSDDPKNFKTYTVSIDDLYIPKPTVIEETREIRELFPYEARLRDLTYDSPLYVNIVETLETEDDIEITKHNRILLGRIPLMIRSNLCYLNNCTKNERVENKECENDEGGYFIIKGKERVLISQLRNVYNIPLVHAQKPGTKYKYICETRSMSEETGHSVLIQVNLSVDERVLTFTLPYIKEQIHVGVVFKALGYKNEEIMQLIGLNCEKAEKYLKLIVNDSFFVEENSGFELFSDDLKEEFSDKFIDDTKSNISLLESLWDQLTIEEKEEYKQKASTRKALRYIGTFSKNPQKENEKHIYAEQVVQNEIFPHLGITSSNKEKAMLLGHMVHKLLATTIGIRQADDRDNYINKRVDSPGMLCHELFRQLYKKYMSTITIQLEKKKQFPDIMSLIPRMTDITKGFIQCFSKGNWGVPKASYVKPGVAQILSRLSYGATLSNLRRVGIPKAKESKNAAIRQINPSQIMFICPVECFDPETQIFMWDGTTKRAGDIEIDDLLVDDFGNPTIVEKTCSGIHNMYNVIPDKSNFTQHCVTDNHILTLRIRQHKNITKSNRKDRNYTHIVKFLNRETNKIQEKYFNSQTEAEEFVNTFNDDDTIDINIKDYLKLNKTTKDHLVLFKIDCINWEHQEVELDPYILGMWLGDGLSTGKGFSLNYKIDHEILAYWELWAEENGAVISKSTRYSFNISSIKNKKSMENGSANNIEEAPLKKYLRKYNLINNKHIPNEYLTNDRETRLKVLAGLIDTDGHVRAEGKEIRITQGLDNYRIIEDAHTLATSLGFSCGLKEGISHWTDEKTGEKKSGTYKELTITGYNVSDIPTILPRKKLTKITNETQIKRSRSFTGSKFKLVEVGDGPFVGWQLKDKRGRFILKDGTTVHNTPEGQPVGIVLNLSLLTRISNRIPTVLIKETIEMCENIVNIEDHDISKELTKVFINGNLIGMTEDSFELLEELREFRMIEMIPWDVSISFDDIDDEIHICSDDGRLLRPVFCIGGDKLLINMEDGTDWDRLIEKRLITYIDNMEANQSVIAFNQNEIKNYKTDYCEIAPAMMFGVMANIIPFPDHSQSPRNTYQAAMGKQAMSMFALSYLIRTDTVVHILNTPQKPLVGTKTGTLMGFDDMPSGNNAIVAIACYTGFNQEDSVILNHSAVKRGLFWATTYKTHSSVEKKDGYISEKIGVCPLKYRKNDSNYGLLDENGIVRTRYPIWEDENGKKHGGGAIYVQKGDVIIGKMLIQNDKDGVENITDVSEIVKKGDSGYIDKVYISITPNGYKLVKITISKVRIPEVGDKFASRAAQKGTVGMVYDQEDMPWTQDGVVPDIIINPHAIPSRMTINQLMESVLGKSCALEGEFGDSTPFTTSSVPDKNGKSIAEQICERLGMNGYQNNGNETLYNGMSGEAMGEFFIGPVYYQRLKHLVSDKMHARDTGPVTTLTRQPLEGRSREGGLRFGEMERDCMIAHGNSKFLQERLFEQSDKYEVTICNLCGNFASNKNSCTFCETDEVSRVKLPYVSKLVLQELNAMLVKTKISVT